MPKLFDRKLALLAVVHLQALPGAPNYGGSLKEVLDTAVSDAVMYNEGGANAIIVENLGDNPYFASTEAPETVASMTMIAHEIKRAVDVPLGINVLRNSWKSALAIASTIGADFIRLNVLTDVVVADQGLVSGEPAEVARYRRSIGAEGVRIFADIYTKHAAPLARRPLRVVAQDMVYRAGADAIVVSGDDSWQPPDADDVDEIRSAVPNTPLIIGSGLIGSVWDLLPSVDGVIYAIGALRPGATRETARTDATTPTWRPSASEAPKMLREFASRVARLGSDQSDHQPTEAHAAAVEGGRELASPRGRGADG